MFWIVFNNLVTLFICMAVGFIAKKVKLIDDRLSKGLSDLLVNITLPATIIVSMQKPFSTEIMGESLIVLFVSAIIYLSGAAIGFLLIKLLKPGFSERGVWYFALMFPNVGYMGFPVSEAIFGKEITFYTSIANMSFNFLVFTLGIIFISKSSKTAQKMNLKAIVFNIPIITTFLGLSFFALSIKVPASVLNAFSMLGNMTTPLSMIIIGAVLAKNKLNTVFKGWKMYVITAFRLIIIPISFFFLLRMFISNQTILNLVIILACMPAAALTAIFAAKYDANELLASQIVFITTLLCLITIPLISLLLF